MHYSWVNRLYSANRASFDMMKCRHINIVFRVELQVSDYFLYLCILVHHMTWEMWIEFPQVVLLPPIPCWNIQAAARYLYHVSSSLLFYLSYACYYRYLTKVHDGQPFNSSYHQMMWSCKNLEYFLRSIDTQKVFQIFHLHIIWW